MSSAKKKPSKWRSLLEGAGSVIVLDPAAGPPPLTRQQLAAERAARMKGYRKGRKQVVTLLRPTGASVDGARKAVVQVAEAIARVLDADGRPPRTLPQLLVFSHMPREPRADVATAVEGGR